MKVFFVDRIGAHAIWGVLSPVAARLIANGDDVFFVNMDDGSKRGQFTAPTGVRIVNLAVSTKRGLFGAVIQNISFACQFKRLIQQQKPDIVHTNFAIPSVVARFVAWLEKVPLIVSTQHELKSSMNFYYRWGLMLTQHFCRTIIYVSSTVAKSFAVDPNQVLVVKHNRTSHLVIANGIDIEHINSVIKDIKQRVPGLIVCAGRMVPEKGMHVLIQSLCAVILKYPHINLRLIGTGPLEQQLKQQVKDLGLADYVEFLGWKSHEEVLCEMAAAELVVVPSDGTQEGFGLVVAEALVCGAAMLVSDIPVFREVLADSNSEAIFFKHSDVSELTNELLKFPFQVSDSQIPRRFLSSQTANKLSAKLMVESYLQIYMTLIKDNSLNE
jgi:glycosyltransferase involved in cell wall biosynthesis